MLGVASRRAAQHGRAGVGGSDARGRAAGAGRGARGGRLGGLGVQLGQVGCFGAPDSVFGLV